MIEIHHGAMAGKQMPSNTAVKTALPSKSCLEMLFLFLIDKTINSQNNAVKTASEM